MSTGLVVEFTKMHGAGNDFIVIDNRFFHFSDDELAQLARDYCPRFTGVGADGLLALGRPESSETHYSMRYFNADGSVGEMCGNGARCLALYASEAGIREPILSFDTRVGVHLAVVGENSIRVMLPLPTEIDLEHTRIALVDGPNVQLDRVIAGVPHAVHFLSDSELERVPVSKWGSQIRHAPEFEDVKGANVDFVAIVHDESEARLRIRTYERGVETETRACGTGAVAAVFAAAASGRIRASQAVVETAGGRLRAGRSDDGAKAFLEGPATIVFRGTLVLP